MKNQKEQHYVYDKTCGEQKDGTCRSCGKNQCGYCTVYGCPVNKNGNCSVAKKNTGSTF